MSTKIYQLKSRYNKIDYLFNICIIFLPLITMVACYFLDLPIWFVIFIGVISYIILQIMNFIFNDLIICKLIERKINALLSKKILEMGFSKDLWGYWKFKMFIVDIKQKKFVYFSEANKYEPFILSNTEIISVKVTNKLETSINHNKSKVETKDDFSLELQYQKENDIVKTIVIPYGDDRIQAEEVGRTIGRL